MQAYQVSYSDLGVHTMARVPHVASGLRYQNQVNLEVGLTFVFHRLQLPHLTNMSAYRHVQVSHGGIENAHRHDVTHHLGRPVDAPCAATDWTIRPSGTSESRTRTSVA